MNDLGATVATVGFGTCDMSAGFGPHDFHFDVESLDQWLDGRWRVKGILARTNPSTLWLCVVDKFEPSTKCRDIPGLSCPLSRIVLRMLRVANNELQYTEAK